MCLSEKLGKAHFEITCKTSALGELGSAAGCFETVLLAFLHSGVAGQETILLEERSVLVGGEQESAGNTVTDGAGLAGNAAALNGGNDIAGAEKAGGLHGLTDEKLKSLKTKVIVDVSVVDGDGAGAVQCKRELSRRRICVCRFRKDRAFWADTF